MLRKLTVALSGLTLTLIANVPAPVLAATEQIAEKSQGGSHVLFIPWIVWVAFLIFAGYLTIEYLVRAWQHGWWPFDGSIHF